MKRFILTFVTLLLCAIKSSLWAYDIAVKNTDGVTIYYNYEYFDTGEVGLEVTYKNNLNSATL